MKNKQRHGCVTAWLLVLIFATSFSTVLNIFVGDIFSQSFPKEISNTFQILITVISICNVFLAISLFQWKKWAFWGLVISSMAMLGINLNIGVGIGRAGLGLLGIVILYGLFQLKKDNVTSWSSLE